MAAVEMFTVVLRQLVALFVGPILILIGYGKLFGDHPPAWTAFVMLALIVAWIALWVRGTIRLVRMRRAARPA